MGADDETVCAFRMEDHIKTKLVIAIHLQEMELQVKPAKKKNNGKGEVNARTTVVLKAKRTFTSLSFLERERVGGASSRFRGTY